VISIISTPPDGGDEARVTAKPWPTPPSSEQSLGMFVFSGGSGQASRSKDFNDRG
jgi:hypothetical protein